MAYQNRFFFFLLMIITFLSSLILFGGISEVLTSSPRISNVVPEIEKPWYWINKLKNPDHILLSPEAIKKMNEENLKRQDLHLFRIKDLKEDWKREEVLQFLEEDWENFLNVQERRYGEREVSLGEPFWNGLKNRMDQESFQKQGRLIYALTVKRTDIRVFPTEEPYNRALRDELDRFQHASLSPGISVGIYHLSKDKNWAYVQSNFIRGWVHLHDVAMAKEKMEVTDYEEKKDRLVVTGNLIHVFKDPSFQQLAFTAQMGDHYPLLEFPGDTSKTKSYYVISIPFRDACGDLTLREGYIREDKDIHIGPLPFTQKNIALQAFKMLNHPYRWGDKGGGKDCSGFLWSLFRTFGIEMPRNSKEQAKIGIGLGLVRGKTIKEKQSLLDQASPMVTLLRSPGHIMLYLGKDKGQYYVIHSVWGIQTANKSGPKFEKIGRVVISDLDLGNKGSNGSLLDQVTDIRMIGIPPEFTK
ncbi:MAG: SH3 domain-containing protein [Syntrophaceae bacterium]|nr:SH3 domain-containing protein [Syntrophaceae bacterium]